MCRSRRCADRAVVLAATLLLQSFVRVHLNRSGMPVMVWLDYRTVQRLCRCRVIVRALNTASPDAGHCCPALLPTRVIAGQCVRASGAAKRAPWIGISRLRVASLRLAQPRTGNDQKGDDWQAHHCLSSLATPAFGVDGALINRPRQSPAGSPGSKAFGFRSVIRPFTLGPRVQFTKLPVVLAILDAKTGFFL